MTSYMTHRYLQDSNIYKIFNTTHTHEKSNQRTHREIKTENTNHNPKLQKSNSTKKSTNPRFMRQKEIEHKKKKKKIVTMASLTSCKPIFIASTIQNSKPKIPN